MIAAVGLIVALLLLVVAFARPLPSERTHPFQSYDTQLRLYATYFILTAVMSLASLASYRAFVYSRTAGSTFALVLAVIMVSPALLGLLAYLIAPRMVRTIYRARESQTSEFLKEVNNICAALHIDPPTCWTSTIPFVSPQVFGAFGRAWLIAPQNVDAMFQAVGQWAGRDSEDTLRTFVANHEVAHLLHRDHRFFTWLIVYVRLILRLWLPVYAVILIWFSFLNLGRPDLSRAVLISYAFALPTTVLTLLYALTLTILRDRELLADRFAFAALATGRRAHLFEPQLQGTASGPLMVLLRLFTAGPGLAIGMAATDYALPRKRGLYSLQGLGQWLIHQVLPRHPPMRVRIEALQGTSDAMLCGQSSLENGVFAGITLALLYLLAAAVTYVLQFEPNTQLSRASEVAAVMVTAGLLGVVFAAPIRHTHRVEWTFSEYSWIQVRKALSTTLSAWCVLVLAGLPAMSLGQAAYLWRVLVTAGAAAYMFGLFGAIDVVRQGRTSWSPHTIWHIPLLVLFVLFGALQVALAFGLWLVPVALMLAAGFRPTWRFR